jgi:alkylhydroperoxidase family enzyme
LLPLYYQVVRGQGALTGFLVAPQGVGAAMAMPTAGKLTDLDPQRPRLLRRHAHPRHRPPRRERPAPARRRRLARSALLQRARARRPPPHRAITLIADTHVPREAHDTVREYFDEEELCQLLWAITAINAWNRIAIACRMLPGEYQPD